jgi:hypothetical protein
MQEYYMSSKGFCAAVSHFISSIFKALFLPRYMILKKEAKNDSEYKKGKK